VLWIALGVLAAAILLLVFNHDAGEIAGIDTDTFARLASASVLILVIGSGVLLSYRGQLGKAGRDIAIWLALLVAIVAAYAFRADIMHVAARVQAELLPGSAIIGQDSEGGNTVELRRRNDGHFSAAMLVNGAAVDMLVDTGASLVVLTGEDARRAGIDTERLIFSSIVSTANGRTEAAPVILDRIGIGDIVFDRVPALVSRENALDESLLGISFLSRLRSYEVRDGALIMQAPAR
jgi:aspartyl protease family protein